ncbi:MAG: hypothetical protein NTZ38_01995 [Candidatus Taylorbacteria bacterium]|nr:hypothetical protein [Candidatus Taylorbacteria bacterium]
MSTNRFTPSCILVIAATITGTSKTIGPNNAPTKESIVENTKIKEKVYIILLRRPTIQDPSLSNDRKRWIYSKKILALRM